ncbi:hypothetical protein QYE76_014275 [Lolium multiflorum]|uniref:Reverse transcriptase domain-containing protein n=1 Tax=Lolium multiflorum TaxID=4521 RepID=A0AAD8X5B8_LOLMU|nr:hypothetical protein QYE76_014275 [Lolium multiflorum]
MGLQESDAGSQSAPPKVSGTYTGSHRQSALQASPLSRKDTCKRKLFEMELPGNPVENLFPPSCAVDTPSSLSEVHKEVVDALASLPSHSGGDSSSQKAADSYKQFLTSLATSGSDKAFTIQKEYKDLLDPIPENVNEGDGNSDELVDYDSSDNSQYSDTPYLTQGQGILALAAPSLRTERTAVVIPVDGSQPEPESQEDPLSQVDNPSIDNNSPGDNNPLNAGGVHQQPAPRMSSRIESMGSHNTRIGARGMCATEATNIPGTNLNTFNSFALLDDDDIVARALEMGVNPASFTLENVSYLKDLEIARHNIVTMQKISDNSNINESNQVLLLGFGDVQSESDRDVEGDDFTPVFSRKKRRAKKSAFHKLVREVSDHNPLILDTLDIKVKNKDFRFEKRWLKEDSFLDRVKRCWDQQVFAKDSLDRLVKKLKNVKKALKGWGANLRGADIKKKKDISFELKELEDLEEMGPLSPFQRSRKVFLQQELLHVLDNEEAFWRQRSRENWLLHGDSNSAFFHRAANGCKRKRTIFYLKKGDTVVQGNAALLEHATAFYKDLFGPVIDSGIRLSDDVWSDDEKLNDFDCVELDKRFSLEEIKEVIDHMEKNKAAGPDGFPIEFYQHCWDIIKVDIMHVFDDLFEHRIGLERINYGIITLIPKIAEADIIQKFRPICLLQVFFKIVTKALTVRTNHVMSKLLLPCQTAFIKGRFISDGVMLLQEILKEDKFRKKQGVILKIDFEKAYDKSVTVAEAATMGWRFSYRRWLTPDLIIQEAGLLQLMTQTQLSHDTDLPRWKWSKKGSHGDRDASDLRAGADGLLRLAGVAETGNSSSRGAGRGAQLRLEDKKSEGSSDDNVI